jgi:acyl-CoA synthetase (AMP-forming)/AMP-acid ligase II
LFPGSTGKPKGICVQHCGVANVVAHKVAELKHAGIAAGNRMLNWMALNFGETNVSVHELCMRPMSFLVQLCFTRSTTVALTTLWHACVLADVHVLDFWVGIAAGCSIVMAPSQQLKDVEAVAALIQQHSIASTSFVPSICQPLLEACRGRPLLSSLRHVSVGGEAVRPAAVAAMLAAAPSVALYNIYGAQLFSFHAACLHHNRKRRAVQVMMTSAA